MPMRNGYLHMEGMKSLLIGISGLILNVIIAFSEEMMSFPGSTSMLLFGTFVFSMVIFIGIQTLKKSAQNSKETSTE